MERAVEGGQAAAYPEFGFSAGGRGADFGLATAPKTIPGVVRPTQAGRAAYGPPLPSASIQKILSARRPPSRAHEHATVRDLVRARAHPPHPITSKSCSPDVHARDENVFCA